MFDEKTKIQVTNHSEANFYAFKNVFSSVNFTLQMQKVVTKDGNGLNFPEPGPTRARLRTENSFFRRGFSCRNFCKL